jgi:hypothetical protein
MNFNSLYSLLENDIVNKSIVLYSYKELKFNQDNSKVIENKLQYLSELINKIETRGINNF